MNDPTKPQICAVCRKELKPDRRAYLLESRVYLGPIPEVTGYGPDTFEDASDVTVTCSKGCARKGVSLLT